MKILVAVKRVVDYNVRVRVKQDKSGIDLDNVKMSMNPFDEIALEEAIRLKEIHTHIISEVIAVSIGKDESKDTLRHALAMGADRGILIRNYSILEPISIAKILKIIVKKENIDLVILGKQAIDDDANQTGQMLAALLDWVQGTFISKIIFKNNILEVTREVDNGLEVIKLPLPAILTTDLRLNNPRYTSLPNIIKAKKKRLDILETDDLGNLNIKKHVKILQVTEPPKRKAGIKVDNVTELIHKLRNEAKVL